LNVVCCELEKKGIDILHCFSELEISLVLFLFFSCLQTFVFS